MSAIESGIVSDKPSDSQGSSDLRERVLSLRLPQGSIAPPRPTRWPWMLAAVIVVGLLLLYFRGSPSGQSTASPVATPTSSQQTSNNKLNSDASPNESATASSGDIALDSKGYIIPVQRILVSPKISGMILRLDILEGRHVNKGDVLAEIEDIDYRADVGHANFALESAKQRLAEIETSRPREIAVAEAELQEGRATFSQIKADYERNRVLFEQSKAISRSEFELAEAKFLANKQHVQALEQTREMMESSRDRRIAAATADVQGASADLRKAQWRLDNCTIRASITGTILKKNAEEGNIVNPIAMNGSFSLCDLADLADMEVEITVQERDISKISVNQNCRIRAEAFPDRLYHGYVSRLMPIADRSKGAIPVRVKIAIPRDEEGVYLKPEMSALVSFLNVPKHPKPTRDNGEPKAASRSNLPNITGKEAKTLQ